MVANFQEFALFCQNRLGSERKRGGGQWGKVKGQRFLCFGSLSLKLIFFRRMTWTQLLERGRRRACVVVEFSLHKIHLTTYESSGFPFYSSCLMPRLVSFMQKTTQGTEADRRSQNSVEENPDAVSSQYRRV